MKSRIILRPAAVADLDEHVLFIALDDVDAAFRLFDAAHDAYRKLSEMPNMGARCEWASGRLAGLRRWPVGGFRNYVIYYLPLDDGIEAVRLLHGARDRPSILQRES